MTLRRLLTIVLLAVASSPAAARGQGGLPDAAEGVRRAWLAHQVGALVQSESVILRLKGAEFGPAPVPAGQAERILSQYLGPARETAFELRAVRATGPEQGYAEARRRYVIRGTADELTETVFLGFRFSGGQWRLSEIRVTP